MVDATQRNSFKKVLLAVSSNTYSITLKTVKI